MYVPTGCAAKKPAAAESPAATISRSPEPSHVALPLTAPEMDTVRAVANLLAVAALPEMLHESRFSTGLYLKASL